MGDSITWGYHAVKGDGVVVQAMCNCGITHVVDDPQRGAWTRIVCPCGLEFSVRYGTNHPQPYPVPCMVCHAAAGQPCNPQCSCAIAQRAIDAYPTHNRGEN
jgi:hypothetical protein